MREGREERKDRGGGNGEKSTSSRGDAPVSVCSEKIRFAEGRVQKKKSEKVWSFAKPGVVKKPNCFFEKSIFQRVSGIILGPPKHVLHLVWSAYFISTAVRTALKVARTPQILGENGNYRSHYKSKKE